MAKKRITSKRGLFGMTYHYENGKYVGKSRPGLLGDRKIHYDSEGHQVGTTRPGFFAEDVTYDARKKRYITTYDGPVGKMHFSNGRSVGRTVPGPFDSSYTSLEEDVSLPEEFLDDADLEESVFDDDVQFDEDYTPTDTDSPRPIWTKIKLILGVLFALEAFAFLIMTVLRVLHGESFIAGIAACLISAIISFLCLKRAKGI